MDDKNHSETLKARATADIAAVFDAYRAATGTSPIAAAKLIYGDPKFGATYATLNFTVGTYDKFMGLMSVCWPEWAEWPASVPRPGPAPINETDLLAIRAKQRRAAPQPGHGEWPSDIPKPEEANHG